MTTVVGREADPTMAASITKQLCHSQKTVYQFYAVRENRDSSTKTVAHLRTAYKLTTTTKTAPTRTMSYSEAMQASCSTTKDEQVLMAQHKSVSPCYVNMGRRIRILSYTDTDSSHPCDRLTDRPTLPEPASSLSASLLLKSYKGSTSDEAQTFHGPDDG